MSTTPFSISVPDSEIDELRRRLGATRFPDVAPNEDFGRGTSGEYLRELVAYWAGEFDWTRQQAALNTLPQFTTTIDDVPLHFIHAPASEVSNGALLLLHGWPDTAFRYRHVVPLLAAAGWDVVVPSLPGFGFSGHRAKSSADTAALLDELMVEVLGFKSYVVAGGDVGTLVGLAMGREHSHHVAGLFLTNADYPKGDEKDLSQDEQEYVGYIGTWWQREGAYAAVQSTKPQIVGPALTDSPAGLAAWMLGLIDTGADHHDVEAAFGGRDELLTNFSLYWFTQTAASAADTYASNPWGPPPARVEVPTGFAIFPREARSPREWCERQARVVRYTRMPRGGHFAALEVPQDYADELMAFSSGLGA